MNISEIDISKLKFADYNPRIITKEEFEGLKASIETFDFVDPIIINKDFTIIGGHQRARAAKELGFKTVPCNILDLDKKTEKKLNVILNSHAISGKYDDLKLAEILEELKLDGDYFDLRLDQLEPIDLSEPEQVEEDNFDGELPKEPITVLGDLYELNNHRLHCADSTNIDDVEKLMKGKKADMVFTDPPYGISYKNNGNDKFGYIKNDDVILEIFPIIYSTLKDNTHCYIWTSHPVYPVWRQQFDRIYKSTVIWFKGGGGMGDLEGDYACNYEMALFCHKGTRQLNGAREGLVWEIMKDHSSSYIHPTQKPVQLAAYALDKSSNRYDVVLDLFLGSGSTLIACEQTHRTCYGQELDPKYCDVIVKRWVTYMEDKGKEFTVKRNGKEIDLSVFFEQDKEEING